MLGVGYSSSLDQELMDLMRSCVNREEGRGEMSANCTIMNVRASAMLCGIVWSTVL